MNELPSHHPTLVLRPATPRSEASKLPAAAGGIVSFKTVKKSGAVTVLPAMSHALMLVFGALMIAFSKKQAE